MQADLRGERTVQSKVAPLSQTHADTSMNARMHMHVHVHTHTCMTGGATKPSPCGRRRPLYFPRYEPIELTRPPLVTWGRGRTSLTTRRVLEDVEAPEARAPCGFDSCSRLAKML